MSLAHADELAVDADNRYRRLYNTAKEELERLQSESAALRREVEVERARRKEAEEAGVEVERRLGKVKDQWDEAMEEQERLSEEASNLRSAFEAERRHHQAEVGLCVEKLRRKDEEIETLREELGMLQSKARTVDRLEQQLELCKEKLEQQQVVRNENDELKSQLDQLLSRQRRQDRASARAHEPASAGRGQEEDDLVLRLLNEQERSSRSNGALQAKAAEVAALEQQRAADRARIAELEHQLEELRRQLHNSPSRPRDSGGGLEECQRQQDQGKLEELQRLLAEREQQLHVHQWRSKAELDWVAAQEALMVSCFHELGLRYQRLKAQNERLQKRLREEESVGD